MFPALNGLEESDDEKSEMEDDQILQQIAAGGLPQSKDTLIALNLTYQEVLQELISKVDGKLALGELKLAALKIEEEEARSEYKVKEWIRVPVLQYIPPYFRDSAGMAPKPNTEAKFKKNQNELDPLVEPAKKWSKREKEKLFYGIRTAAVEKELAPLKEKHAKLSDDFKKASPGEHAALTKKLTEVQKKMDKILSKVDISKQPPGFFPTIDWNKISATDMSGTRTSLECRLVFFNNLHPTLNQERQWGEGEMNRLGDIAEKHKYINWQAIAAELGTGRTAFQCFEKYQMVLNPEINKRDWNEVDDDKIREAVQACRIGEYIPWEQVAGSVEGRTRSQCQMRWMRKLDPNLKAGRWSKEEDDILIAAVQKYGVRGWRKIAIEVPGRTEAQCRERWTSALRGDIKTGPWSPEEDKILVDAMETGEKINWPKIYALVPGRTSTACKVRYRSLTKAKAGSKKRGRGKGKKEKGEKKKKCGKCQCNKEMKKEVEDEKEEEAMEDGEEEEEEADK